MPFQYVSLLIPISRDRSFPFAPLIPSTVLASVAIPGYIVTSKDSEMETQNTIGDICLSGPKIHLSILSSSIILPVNFFISFCPYCDENSIVHINHIIRYCWLYFGEQSCVPPLCSNKSKTLATGIE